MDDLIKNNSYYGQAKIAHERNELLHWTINHLQTDPRNKELIEHIKSQQIIVVELKNYPLKHLKRIEGLQNGEEEMESIDVWVQKVDTIVQALKENTSFGPLIVTDFWDKLEIADGNHRHEALLKSGYETFWTIFLLTKTESLEQLTKNL